jgi:hypothetical protein
MFPRYEAENSQFAPTCLWILRFQDEDWGTLMSNGVLV